MYNNCMQDSTEELLRTRLNELDTLLLRFAGAIAREASGTTLGARLSPTRQAVAELTPGDVSHSCVTIGNAFRTIRYGIEDEVNASPITLGVVGANDLIIELASQVNEAKARLKEAVRPLMNKTVRVVRRDRNGNRKVVRQSKARSALANLGHADVNLLAAYRQVPIIHEPLVSAAFTLAMTRSVRKLSKDQTLELFAPRADQSFAQQRDWQLIADSADEQFALVRRHYRTYRANLVFVGKGDTLARRMVSTYLPIVYRLVDGQPSPEIHFPDRAELRSVPRKREARISQEPIIESVPIHRYLRF